MDTNIQIQQHEKLIRIAEMIANNEGWLQRIQADYKEVMALGNKYWYTHPFFNQRREEALIAQRKAVSTRLISYYNNQLAKCRPLIKTAKPKGTMLLDAMQGKGVIL